MAVHRETANDITSRYLAIDCEFVGVVARPYGGQADGLARVSIVDYHGKTVLDSFVKPDAPVKDYRTWVSGVRAEDIKGAPTFEEIRDEVVELLEGKILVGHALSHDFEALKYHHPTPDTRDTVLYRPFQLQAGSPKPALRKLADLCLGVTIQKGSHFSVIDAAVTMLLFRKVQAAWEPDVALPVMSAEVAPVKDFDVLVKALNAFGGSARKAQIKARVAGVYHCLGYSCFKDYLKAAEKADIVTLIPGTGGQAGDDRVVLVGSRHEAS